MDPKGLFLCARYSAAPNFFGYCGPDENRSLIQHLKEKKADKEVQSILSEFESLYLNLNLIAHENKIRNPFAAKVVEAYWIGNPLLTHIKNIDYVSLLKEKFELEKKMGNEAFSRLKYKFLNNKLLPQHSFHVFNIFKRTGNLVVNQTLATMDSCRISFGQVVNPDSLLTRNVIVRTKPLEKMGGKLHLGRKTLKSLRVDYRGKIFLKELNVGDWVSFHWGFVCDLLTAEQVKNLEFYTQKAIDFYNI
ncbi:hypothetical protein A3F60_03370 [Candidatus Roizmanbacteria bacterium RIFCSPHIGHO2_12_FULL_39_8]|uniref:Uncharacterized protein n=2 Tax=Candidatus Roizmaniibacteriota TaxID=1752723 RepID=A0A1F7I3U3_9BACT|nr:MAG: hypothetical protein A3F60_03370 [Candidatus Roizmanbacteria bacterium RIFCSPHIGHO2_12_FULL_39_8]